MEKKYYQIEHTNKKMIAHHVSISPLVPPAFLHVAEQLISKYSCVSAQAKRAAASAGPACSHHADTSLWFHECVSKQVPLLETSVLHTAQNLQLSR